MVRPAVKSDMVHVIELICELAIFEREPDAVELTQADLERDGFGDAPKFKCFVAEIAEKIVGMALVYTRYSTWKGETIHLEDLIVKEDYRGRGIGKELLEAVIRYGQEKSARRIEWAVLEWNTKAISFYESFGAVVCEDWRVVRLES